MPERRDSAYLRGLRAQNRAYQSSRDYGRDYGALGTPYTQEMEVLQQGEGLRQKYRIMSGRINPQLGSQVSGLLTDHASLGGNLLQQLLEQNMDLENPAVEEIADNDDGGIGLGFVGDVLGWAADRGRDALHIANEQAIKPFVRTVDLIGESAYHELSRAIVSIGTIDGSGLGGVAERYADYGDSNLVNLAQGQGEGMDMGTGYFVGGALKERTESEGSYDIEGQRANLGRFLASNTVGKMYDPGDAVYDVVAGVSEFGLAVALDPLAKVSQPLAAGRTARRSLIRNSGQIVAENADEITTMERWRFNAGLLKGDRKNTIIAERTQAFLSDPKLRQSLADADAYTIAQRWGKSSASRFNIDIAGRLGAASTPDEVGTVLEELIDAGKVENKGFFSGPGHFVRSHLVDSDNMVSKALRIDKVLPEADPTTWGKLSGLSPRGSVHIEDLDEAAMKYDSLQRQAGVPRELRASTFDDISRVNNGDWNGLVQVHNKVLRNVATSLRLRGAKGSKLDTRDIEDLTPDQITDLISKGELEEVVDGDMITLTKIATRENTDLDKIATKAIDEISNKFSEQMERMQKSAFRAFGIAADGDLLNPSYAPSVSLVDPITKESFDFIAPFPTAEAELGSMALSLPDPTIIRRAATKNSVARHIYSTKGWGKATTYANNLTTKVFRPLALMRLAFGSREFIEGQMSLTAGGHMSMLNSPGQFLKMAWNLGEDGWREVLDPSYIRQAADAAGTSGPRQLAEGVRRRFEVLPTKIDPETGNRVDAWKDLMGDDWSKMAYRDGVVTRNASGHFAHDPAKATSRLFSPVTFDKPTKENLIAWTKEMGRLRASPSYVQMAKVNGNLDEWTDWALNTPLGRQSIDSLAGEAIEAGRVTREDAVAELAGIVQERLSTTLGGTGLNDWDDELGQLWAEGKIPMPEYVKNGRMHRKDWNSMSDEDFEFFELLRRKHSEAKFPKTVKVEAVRETDRLFESDLFEGLANVIFNWAPSKFTRNPATRARYIDNTAELMDMAATDELRDQILAQAVDHLGIAKGSPEYLRMAEARTRAKGIEGVVDNIVDYADLVRGRSVDEVMQTVFDIPNRSAGQDTFIAILPFLDAWKESMERWSVFVKDNPSFFIRAMSGVRELQNQGTFYTNDFGEMVFQYPGSGALVQAINTLNGGRSGDFGVRMEGRVAGLNIATDSIGPGFGPLVQIPAALFKDPDLDSLRDMIAPFGVKVDNPADLPGVLASLAPAWSQKMLAAFDKDYDPKAFNASATQFLDAFSMSGKYNLDDPEQVQQMVKDAERAARLTLMARSITQFTAPTGPGAAVEVPFGEVDRSEADWDPQVDPQGKWHTIYSVAADYHRLAELYGWDVAGQKWFEMYGKDPFFAAQGGSTTEGRELPVTKEGDSWYRKNQDFAQDFEYVAGYFAPGDEDGKGLDYTAMNRQYLAGQRKTLSAKEQAQMAMATRTRSMWNAAVRQTENLPSAQKLRVREQIKAALENANPGWQNPTIAFPRAANKIAELQRAVDDERVSDNPLTEPLRAYFETREAVLEEIKQRTGRANASLKTREAADLRDELRQVGLALQTRHPAFAGVWSNLLMSELEE